MITLNNDDYIKIEKIKNFIYSKMGNQESLSINFPIMIRKLIEDVIDTPQTNRKSVYELEKTEKTYIGTKIEIALKNKLDLKKGKLDLYMNNIGDVDIKNTIKDNWMIPPEAINNPCILIKSNEKTALYSFGIFIAKPEYLTNSSNRDKKKSLTTHGKNNIVWILKDCKYPNI